eukprot:8098566-Alexandrium_andersonii.AAC.1
MSASLVGSEMCIRDSPSPCRGHPGLPPPRRPAVARDAACRRPRLGDPNRPTSPGLLPSLWPG